MRVLLALFMGSLLGAAGHDLMVGTARARLHPEQIAAPKETETVNILGYYAMTGTDARGKQYLGTVLIAQAGTNYSVTWLIEDGQVCKGIGLREGESLMVGAVQGDTLVVFRFAIAEVDGKPKLSGRYAQGSSNGQETLTLLRRPSL